MTNEPAETPHFDPVAIDKLRAVAGDQGESFVKEMAQLFLDETTKSLAELGKASDQGEWKLVTRAAHSLKSSAATLGLLKLSSACKALELDTKNASSGPRTPELVRAVLDEFEAAKPTLKRLS
ncbi:MAG TPA: Hpt domain-containing protein [Vicinamibacteria bacterium]|nr:Hpt domain-containing protein [Vicinamibacteria bacterium]